MKYVSYFILMLMLTSHFVYSQNGTSERSGMYAIGLKIGTDGFGVNISRAMSDKLDLSVEGNFFQINKNFSYTYSNEDLDITTKVNWGNINMKASYYLFNNSGFSIFGGLAFHFQKKFEIKIQTTEELKIGSKTTISPDDVGYINLIIDGANISPMMGIALGKEVPNNKLQFRMEIGAYYYGPPSVNIIGSGLLKENESQGEIIENNISDYRFYPIFSFRLCYKIKK